MSWASGLPWTALGARGDRYPAELQRLRGRSGVYAIREAGGGDVLYVGESHSDRLYRTLIRHFSTWSRTAKPIWERVLGLSSDPGLTYRRDKVEAAWRVSTAADAVELQSIWIRRLSPRDNGGPSSWVPDVPDVLADDDLPF